MPCGRRSWTRPWRRTRPLNERAARWDGIERIEADGTIVFTAPFLGYDRVGPDEVDAVADELEARR